MSNIKKQSFAEVMGIALDAQEKAERAEEISKQDKQGARTAAQLEQKISFGKRFAEVMGIALDAQEKAKDAEKLDEKLTSEEIFNRLTNNGKLQGLYRGDDGELYINAEYIRSIEAIIDDLFANNINMSGKLTHTVETYLPPGIEEITTIENHIFIEEPILPQDIPLYDYNNDGAVDIIDLAAFGMLQRGERSMEEWDKAVKSTVTLTIDLKNPEKFITVTGTNMWDRKIEQYIGVLSSSYTEKQVERGTTGFWTYEKWADGTAKCWCLFSKTVNFSQDAGIGYYTSLYQEFAEGLFAEAPEFADVKTCSPTGLITTSINGITKDGVSWFTTHFVRDTPGEITMDFMIKAIGRWK